RLWRAMEIGVCVEAGKAIGHGRTTHSAVAPGHEHDPENACPGPDPGSEPVFGIDHAQAKVRAPIATVAATATQVAKGCRDKPGSDAERRRTLETRGVAACSLLPLDGGGRRARTVSGIAGWG